MEHGTRPLRAVIFTGRFGMGHCAAAEALRQTILEERPDAAVRVVDVMDYLFPEASGRIYAAFGLLVRRCAWVYNLLNRAAGAHAAAPLQGVVVRKLDALAAEADLMIAVMPVCAQYLSAYKRQRGSDIPVYTYITDVTAHGEWIAPGVDRYFVAAPETRESLAAMGVDPARVTVCGIPVRRDFRRARPDARRGRRVLVMGGGLGLIPEAEAILEALCADPAAEVTVVTGRNEALRRRLASRFPGAEVLGYTDQVSRLMRAADLVVTKSGGITTFEAICTQTPLYVLRPFLVQEVGNARYIEGHGLGWVGWHRSGEAAVRDVTALLKSPLLLAEMRRNMAAVRRSWSPCSPLGYLRGPSYAGAGA